MNLFHANHITMFYGNFVEQHKNITSATSASDEDDETTGQLPTTKSVPDASRHQPNGITGNSSSGRAFSSTIADPSRLQVKIVQPVFEHFSYFRYPRLFCGIRFCIDDGTDEGLVVLSKFEELCLHCILAHSVYFYGFPSPICRMYVTHC